MAKNISPELEKALELIDNGYNIFIIGGGGVGKSYILSMESSSISQAQQGFLQSMLADKLFILGLE